MKKKNFFYESFVIQIEYAIQAMTVLKEGVDNFKKVNLLELKNKIHEIEHNSDIYKHGLEERLAKEFITPIDREDIFVLYDHIDDLIDSIDEVSYKFYLRNYKTLPKNISIFAQKSFEAISALKQVFENFKYIDNKKVMDPLLKKVIEIEEEVDRLFEENVRREYVEHPDDVVKNHDAEKVYNMFEYITDKCRDVVKSVSIIMYKNL